MSKRIKLVSPTCSASEVKPTNWEICVLCQYHHGTLVYPSEKGYSTLATNILDLKELNKVPLNINISRLDDGCGIEDTFILHKAKWHKACYVLCNASKVVRARKLQVEKTCLESPVKHHLRGKSVPPYTIQATGSLRPACLFCDHPEGDLHKAETMTLDTRVRQCAIDMRDTKLLAKLSAGDMVAIDSVYHKNCLTSFYNNHRSLSRKISIDPTYQMNPESLALAEVVSHIEEFDHLGEDINHVFKLTDLKLLYRRRLHEFGGEISQHIHSTRLAQKIQQHIPSLEIHNSKFGIVLSFKKDIGDTLLGACHTDPDTEAVMFMRVAKLVRKELFSMKYHYDSSLCDEQYDKLPKSLSSLVKMILEGPNTKLESDENKVSTAASTIVQLLIFNAVNRGRKDTTPRPVSRHNLDRETVLPLYLGLLIHNRTRKRDLIDTLFANGLSVSYDRVLQFSTDEANRVIRIFENEGLVCPTILRDRLFTTGNLDNIDHNPTSTSSHDSFHGTALSITQHLTYESHGIHRCLQDSQQDHQSKSIKSLPDSYSHVPPISLPGNIKPPICEHHAIPPSSNIDEDELQIHWLTNVNEVMSKADDKGNMNISWSAYFANMQESVPKPPAIISLLPLFRDNAHSPTMVKHGMDIIQQITNHVNPGQIPVLTVDQPLYAIAKKIQWAWPDKYGERLYVILMGGLHIEMAMLKVLGNWLEGSGWVFIMTKADITTEGRAVGLQKGSHTSRGQWAHQVTAAALFCLLSKAFAEYQTTTSDDNKLDFGVWCKVMAEDHPQFDYWHKVLHLEVLFLQFLRSQREGNYLLYVESLGKIIPWMFALDHYHYARWMTVHVKDLVALQNTCPTVHEEFVKGNFVTQKSHHKFSALAHDQVHEQLNAMVKGDGGVIGITENEAALKRWMIAGPEMARLLSEYEVKHAINHKITLQHHEQIPNKQRTFFSHVKGVIDVVEELGSPFTENSTDLYTLDTKVIMPDAVVETVRTVEDKGKTTYQRFVKERLNDDATAFNDTIPKNNLPLFSNFDRSKTKSTSKVSTSNLKTDVHLFSRMYISCQARGGDLDSFFDHENHAWPPSLSSNNVMHQTTKSDLVHCLELLVPQNDKVPDVDVRIVDGAALIHTLDPKRSHAIKTFQDYAQNVFLPYIVHMLRDVVRIDVVWDIYRKDSLKAQTRQSRGSTGNKLQITRNTSIAANWTHFLRVDANKEGLFKFLATTLQEFQPPVGKTIISTYGENAISSPILDLSDLRCTHEEADTRLLFHAAHAIHNGLSKVMIHATDTDVVVLAITVSSTLEDSEVWVAFGHGTKLRYIPCHLIAVQLGPESAWGLLFMHAISGCDTVSAFYGIGKKTAWSVWCSMPQITTTFARLSKAPSQVTSEAMDEIERYVVLLYQRTSSLSKVNEARKRMFASTNRRIQNIPPTRHALVQHVKRAAYQAGHIWGQTLVGDPTIPSPTPWGWERLNTDSPWTPYWTTQPEAAKACQELLRCGCKKACVKQCKCVKANLKCTQLCYCAGQCNRESE